MCRNNYPPPPTPPCDWMCGCVCAAAAGEHVERRYPFSYLKTITRPAFHLFSRKTTLTHTHTHKGVFRKLLPFREDEDVPRLRILNPYTYTHTQTHTQSTSQHETQAERLWRKWTALWFSEAQQTIERGCRVKMMTEGRNKKNTGVGRIKKRKDWCKLELHDISFEHRHHNVRVQNSPTAGPSM